MTNIIKFEEFEIVPSNTTVDPALQAAFLAGWTLAIQQEIDTLNREAGFDNQILMAFYYGIDEAVRWKAACASATREIEAAFSRVKGFAADYGLSTIGIEPVPVPLPIPMPHYDL